MYYICRERQAELGVPPAVCGIVPAELGLPPAGRGILPAESGFPPTYQQKSSRLQPWVILVVTGIDSVSVCLMNAGWRPRDASGVALLTLDDSLTDGNTDGPTYESTLSGVTRAIGREILLKSQHKTRPLPNGNKKQNKTQNVAVQFLMGR